MSRRASEAPALAVVESEESIGSRLSDLEGRVYNVANLCECVGAAPESPYKICETAVHGAMTIAYDELQLIATELQNIRYRMPKTS